MSTNLDTVTFRMDKDLKKELLQAMYEKAAADPEEGRWSLQRCFTEAIENYVKEHKNA